MIRFRNLGDEAFDKVIRDRVREILSENHLRFSLSNLEQALNVLRENGVVLSDFRINIVQQCLDELKISVKNNLEI